MLRLRISSRWVSKIHKKFYNYFWRDSFALLQSASIFSLLTKLNMIILNLQSDFGSLQATTSKSTFHIQEISECQLFILPRSWMYDRYVVNRIVVDIINGGRVFYLGYKLHSNLSSTSRKSCSVIGVIVFSELSSSWTIITLLSAM